MENLLKMVHFKDVLLYMCCRRRGSCRSPAIQRFRFQ